MLADLDEALRESLRAADVCLGPSTRSFSSRLFGSQCIRTPQRCRISGIWEMNMITEGIIEAVANGSVSRKLYWPATDQRINSGAKQL